MKKALALLLAFAMALSLAACAQTPDSAIVAQKNNERLVEAATTEDENRQSLAETQSSAPERYTFDYTSEDGMVEITADAEVTLPETDTIPMYQLSCREITQEQATAIYNFFFEGKETWRRVGNQEYSKEMADAELVDVKKKLAEAEAAADLDEEEREMYIQGYQEEIAFIEDGYDSLPDTSKAKIESVDSTYRIEEKEGEEYQILEANTDDGDSLRIISCELGGDTASGMFFAGATEVDYTINSLNGDAVTPEEAEALCKCDLSYDEAKALADSFLDIAGVEARLAQTSLLKGSTGYTDTFDGTSYHYEEDYSAYSFFYGRIVDGIPVAVTTSAYYADTSISWLYESIQIVVNNDGVVVVSWDYPTTLEESVSGDVSILPFETAAETFETMEPLIYQGNVEAVKDITTKETKFEVNVERVELNLMRVKDSGDKLTGLYVPAWVFYGTETEHSYYSAMDLEDDYTEASPWIVLAVNAVDGSVIDVVNGY